MFRSSVVLMDGLAPQRGAFPHALEVAQRLQVPVRGISSLAWKGASGEEEARTCAEACSRANVPWDWSHQKGPLQWEALRTSLTTQDLLVFGQALPAAQRQDLF